MGKKTNIAIITARGGSKRIPNKNIRDFCGKPMISYAIRAALQAGIYDTVMVSTDSDNIADIARRFGAEVPFLRSAAAADDYATTGDVLLEVLGAYAALGKSYEYFTCLYPTAPFVTADKLVQAARMLKEDAQAKMVMPVTAFSYPPLRGYVMKDGKLEMKWPEYFPCRSQDLDTIYHDAGQFYCYRTEAFLEAGGVITQGILPLVVGELEVQDIDNETDWEMAELKYRRMMSKEGER